MKFTLALFAVATLIASATAFELTNDNWDSATAGKSVFVKFFAPVSIIPTPLV